MTLCKGMPEITSIDPSNQTSSPYVSPGMPELDMSGKKFSFFEFWPTWLMYLPVVLQWLILSIYYRSLTLPLLANPKLPLSGMVGVGKSQLMNQASGECEEAILDWFLFTVGDVPADQQIEALLLLIVQQEFSFPLVCKPDIGCRGAGVQLIKNRVDLLSYLTAYPVGAKFQIQKLAQWEAEAGIFYVREPDQEKGKIVSMALKYMPYVVGDGQHTLKQLIAMDPRAGQKQSLYLERHAEQLDSVIPLGEPFRLIFSASHCKGAVFRNAVDLVTPALTEKLNALMSDIPEFYYGRLDVKFADVDALKRGETIEIIEINTASSESLHIWDRNTSLPEALGSLLRQYRTLFRLGHQNRKRGYRTPGLYLLLQNWQRERKLTELYPQTD